jgi:hypothetical protein
VHASQTEQCCDKLRVDLGDGVERVYSGTSIPGPLYSSSRGGTVQLRFTSDNSITGAGFVMDYSSVVSAGSSSAPVGLIVGLVVGLLSAALLVICVVCSVRRSRRARRRREQAASRVTVAANPAATSARGTTAAPGQPLTVGASYDCAAHVCAFCAVSAKLLCIV